MSVVYSIRDWNTNFEVSQNRKVIKWSWVATPLKHDGKSFRRLMAMPDGATVYGAWMLIVQVAAKCPIRGILRDGDGPLTPEDLAIKTGCPISVFENALKVLTSQHIGWMLVEQWEGGGITLPLQERTEQDRTQPTNQPEKSPGSQQPSGHGTRPPATKPGTDGRTDGFDSSWEGVGDRLAALSITNWRQALSEAQACGCTPLHAHELIDFWEANPGRWKVGAIVWRFKHSNPQTPVDRCWPEPGQKSEEVAARETKRAATAKRISDEGRAMVIIKAGRLAKNPDEVIKAELAAAGLEWPR
jgi:hypothetical protein